MDAYDFDPADIERFAVGALDYRANPLLMAELREVCYWLLLAIAGCPDLPDDGLTALRCAYHCLDFARSLPPGVVVG